MQVNTHMCSYIQKHPPSSSSCCPYLSSTPLLPLFVLQVSATVVKENVAVFGQSSLHHPNAAVEETLKFGRVQNLLPLLLCQLSKHWKWACREIYYIEELITEKITSPLTRCRSNSSKREAARGDETFTNAPQKPNITVYVQLKAGTVHPAEWCGPCLLSKSLILYFRKINKYLLNCAFFFVVQSNACNTVLLATNNRTNILLENLCHNLQSHMQCCHEHRNKLQKAITVAYITCSRCQINIHFISIKTRITSRTIINYKRH